MAEKWQRWSVIWGAQQRPPKTPWKEMYGISTIFIGMASGVVNSEVRDVIMNPIPTPPDG